MAIRPCAKRSSAALRKIIQQQGRKTEQQTNEYVEKLKADKRYKCDVYRAGVPSLYGRA
jgi:sulfite reductase alpha subunit-like flavoprotein